ncbi:MAG TPA: MMPL family transporter, partial [Thermoleophilaceae bacterium]
VALLALLGAGVESRLHRQDLVVPGTKSAKAAELAKKHFGDAQNLVVVLEGPQGRLEQQTKTLAERLDRLPHVDTVGPWAPGAGKELRPNPNRMVVLLRLEQEFEGASQLGVPRVRATVRRTLRGPVHAYVSGYADVAAGIDRESIAALKRAEVFAAPLLIIVLLLVFRSPVAALLPLALGMVTIAAGRGLIDIANRVWSLDVVALNMASMMGLALGVDYSLVLVSRFREELAAGRSTVDAVRVASRTAGHTILFAGVALACAMIAANLVAPGGILFSSGMGVLTSVILSVASAAVALPAVLLLLGERVNKWSFGGKRESARGGWSGLVLRATHRPVLAAALIMVALGALAAPALGLAMGPPDPRALPASSPERRDFEHIYHSMGGGWTAPYEVIVAAKKGRATDPERLEALGEWQRRIAGEPEIRGVFGPEPIAQQTKKLKQVQSTLTRAGSAIQKAKRDQARLGDGLTKVGDGVGQVRTGLAQAAAGAQALAGGADKGGDGAARLQAGLDTAAAGARRLQDGLGQADAGASALARGDAQLTSGAGRLERGLRRAADRTRASLPEVERLRSGLAQGSGDMDRLRGPAQDATAAVGQAASALQRMTVGKADPQYVRALEAVMTAQGNLTGKHPLTGAQVQPGYDGMDASLAKAGAGMREAADGVARLEQGSRDLVAGLDRLGAGAARLRSGIGRLQDGTHKLLAGLGRLRNGGGDLASGLAQLKSGGDALANGAGRLRGGANRLAGGLSSGAERVTQLQSGVGRIQAGVKESRKRTAALALAFRSGPASGGGDAGGGSGGPGGGGPGGGIDPAIFDSGYLPLAAIDGAPHEQRVGAGFAVNLDRGGDAARLVVMRQGDPTNPGDPVRKRLEREAQQFGRLTGSEVAVGGPATLLQDFQSESEGRLWWLVLALAASTYFVLIPVLRSLLLPLLAVMLNLATVFAAIGVLTLGFQGAAPLGGPGEVDAIMVLAIFGIVFGLSIDYEVFLLARMREGWLRTGTTEGAVEYGLKHTAGVITGAALIMTGVFAAFAISDVANMRQLGVGLTVAVLLDATVVRLILLPAIIRMTGGASWWLPRPLSRLLPAERPLEDQPQGRREPFARFGEFAGRARKADEIKVG